MATYKFARNTEREYYSVSAETEEAARALLDLDDSKYSSGCHSTDVEDEPYELIDTDEDEDFYAQQDHDDTPCLDASFHVHEMDIG